MSSARQPWVLMYHSVGDASDDPYSVTITPAVFERQLRWLRRQGLRGVAISELLDARSHRGLVGLTFDDGYADFATTAVPLMQRFGFTATTYVLSGLLGDRNRWDEPGPVKPLMTAEQVRAVADAGFEVGSHGARHVSLLEAPPDVLEHEVAGSRAALAELLGRHVRGFTYPYGHVGQREVAAVRTAGYDHACAIWPGASTGRHALLRSFAGERDGVLRLTAKRARDWWRARSALERAGTP